MSHDDICLAQKTLEPISRKTELIESMFFSQGYGNRVFIISKRSQSKRTDTIMSIRSRKN
ncbi:MAG: hypothetical protein GX672_09865 [Synergistaceae bacterium]|nr:hypothetical protein [Synergistaceae bacterium]